MFGGLVGDDGFVAYAFRGVRGGSEWTAGQADKCTRWMPWQQEAMKDVGACEKLWLAGKQAMTQRCPNGETQLSVDSYRSGGANAGN